MGSAFRLADAVGAELYLLGSTPTPPNRKLNKTARSTVRHVPYVTRKDAIAFLDAQLEGGTYLLALEVADESKSLFEFKLPREVCSGRQRLLIIPGTEKNGVSPAILERCAASVHLPMYGVNTSVNVAVALGAAMYVLLPQLTTARG